MAAEFIKIEVKDFIALVTLDRPPVNAVNAQLYDELMLAFDILSDREDVRVAILTGAGRAFCAGYDIKEGATLEPKPGDYWQTSRRAREAMHSIRECTVPVIGAINGAALGAGLAIAASCDILYGSEHASLGLPEVNVGLLGGSRHLMNLFSHSKVRRMFFTGDRVGGEELHQLGIIEECVAAGELMGRVRSLAEVIASKSPVAIRLAKHSLNTIETMSLRDGYRFEQNMTRELVKHPDSKEAMRAFVEKRPPVFGGES